MKLAFCTKTGAGWQLRRGNLQFLVDILQLNERALDKNKRGLENIRKILYLP